LVIYSRYTIEDKNKAVEPDKLKKLLEIACYAPSAKNGQSWNWIVVQNPKDVRPLANMVVA